MSTEKQRAYDRQRYLARKEREPRFWQKRAAAAVEAARKRRAEMEPEWRVRKDMLAAARRRAKEKGLTFNLTLEDTAIPPRCAVLGIEFSFTEQAQLPTLDRIDNNAGYEPHNVWVISFRANTLKNNFTSAELRTAFTSCLIGVMESAERQRMMEAP